MDLETVIQSNGSQRKINIIYQCKNLKSIIGFPGDPSGREPACQCRRLRDIGFIPGSGRSPGGGHGNPLQSSFLENPMDRGAWQAVVHRVAKS